MVLRHYPDELLMDQIRRRYRFDVLRRYDNRKKAFPVIDCVAPKEMHNLLEKRIRYIEQEREDLLANDMLGPRFSGDNIACFSEFNAMLFGAPVIDGDDLISMIGYTRSDIAKIGRRIRSMNPKLFCIGAGGSVSNFLYWTYRLMHAVNMSHIFQHITVFDDDNWEPHNLFRIPFVPEPSVVSASTSKVYGIPHRMLNYLSRRIFVTAERLTSYGPIRTDNTIAIGAPDLETRQELHDTGTRYIALLHGGDETEARITPRIENIDMTIENYGQLNLNIFYFQMLRTTVHILESIADGSYWRDGLDTVMFEMDGESVPGSANGKNSAIYYLKDR